MLSNAKHCEPFDTRPFNGPYSVMLLLTTLLRKQ